MSSIKKSIQLGSPEATDRLAAMLAPLLVRGNTLLLDGPIGAGKTHFARALIQARLQRDEPVPSPSYTLVQTYLDGDIEIWHADLFRLSDADEVAELGLDSALSGSICLIEWPDRADGLWPPTALKLSFSLGSAPGTRDIAFAGDAKIWGDRLRHVLGAMGDAHA